MTNAPHYTTKQFNKMIAKIEADIEEVERLIEQGDFEDYDRAMGWLVNLQEQHALEHHLAQHHAYGPYAEHASVARWA